MHAPQTLGLPPSVPAVFSVAEPEPSTEAVLPLKTPSVQVSLTITWSQGLPTMPTWLSTDITQDINSIYNSMSGVILLERVWTAATKKTNNNNKKKP